MYILKENLLGFDLQFTTAPDLFSAKKVDAGTKMLIGALEIKDGDTCLDLGCGYGPVGVVMAKINQTGKVYLVDRDLVATEYAELNCRENKLNNYEVRLSNGFNNLRNEVFNVIAANLPSHIAKESLIKLIQDAKSHLVAGGKFFVVIVTRLKEYVQRELRAVFEEVTKLDQSEKYAVLLAVKK